MKIKKREACVSTRSREELELTRTNVMQVDAESRRMTVGEYGVNLSTREASTGAALLIY